MDTNKMTQDNPLILADDITKVFDMGAIQVNALREGNTIVMVTHEEYIAEHAERILNMRDGKIVED